jgi:hypothetical protein
MRVASLVALLIASGVAVEGGALIVFPNLASNPAFDTSIAGWIGGGVQATWAGADAGDDPNSGSVREVRQCIPIVGGARTAAIAALLSRVAVRTAPRTP